MLQVFILLLTLPVLTLLVFDAAGFLRCGFLMLLVLMLLVLAAFVRICCCFLQFCVDLDHFDVNPDLMAVLHI